MKFVEANIMNFLTTESEREMHYLKGEDGKYYLLSLEDDAKVEEIKEDNNVEVESYEGYEVQATAELVEDKDKIKEVFDAMIDENNSWFSELTDDLILIIATEK